MWATFNYNNFPIISVDFDGKVKNDEELQIFLDEWTRIYTFNKKFTLIFNTSKVGWIDMSYGLKMRNFINNLKEDQKPYLERSIIIVSNIWIKMLLNFIFNVDKPLAPVFLYKNTTGCKINYPELLKKILKEETDDFTIINN